jgi:5-(carboxyamino)imidazole ribonucleotide mutase
MSSPKVGIIMGSNSDLPVMQAAADVLKQFSIEYEIDIVSAHRTPEKMFEYAKSAVERGLQVIIAGAGGAAHLPGMVCANAKWRAGCNRCGECRAECRNTCGANYRLFR